MKLGSVIAIEVPGCGYGYVRAYLDDQLGTYSVITASQVPVEQVVQHPILDVLWIDYDELSNCRAVGTHRFKSKKEAWGPLRRYGSGNLIYDCGDIRRPKDDSERTLPRMSPDTSKSRFAAFLADDIISVVYTEFVSLRSSGLSNAVATKRIEDSFAEEVNDIEDFQRVYLALGAAQAGTGYVPKRVRRNVLSIISQRDYPDSVAAIEETSPDTFDLLAKALL